MSRIFISYKRIDKDKVFKIKNQIESSLGEKCWIDLDGIESDAQFKNVIIRAINKCEIVLFMYSKTHTEIKDFENDWTIRELGFAKDKGKRIVFINLDGSPLTDEFLFDYGRKQQVDALQQVHLNKLIQDLTIWLRGKTDNNENEHSKPKMIDLGLNVLWATSNVGATVDNTQGEYYAWGEVFPKKTYTKENCKTEGMLSTDLEICHIISDKTNCLTEQQDVVHNLYGDGYRLPTRDDLIELFSKCTFLWTEENGTKGYKVIGPNKKNIFLPITGYKQGKTTLNCKSVGYYWLSNNCLDSKYSYALFFDEQIIDPIADARRFLGLAIRPVSDKKHNTTIPIPLGEYCIEVGWHGEDDLDMVAFLLNKDGVISDEFDFVFFNSVNRTAPFDKNKYSSRKIWMDNTMPMSLDGSTIGEPTDWVDDNDTIKAMMTLDLKKVREEVTEIVFGLSMYQDYTISSKKITLRLYDTNFFDIETTMTGMAGKSSLTICKFLKGKDNVWSFTPSANYFDGGLQTLLDKYT